MDEIERTKGYVESCKTEMEIRRDRRKEYLEMGKGYSASFDITIRSQKKYQKMMREYHKEIKESQVEIRQLQREARSLRK